ncbi:MAG TPA: class I SAM-dependent methyltransferase [Candidatus Sulfotelmatobacter sp.]|nr:class I SAM-dependent methyltransferase [Candidatus Sulfotelmatobacter sp.]
MTSTPTTPVQPRSEVSPFRLFQAINGFQLTEAISSAIELDIFTVIAAGHTTAKALAKQCSIAERGARILCDFLVVNGFLEKNGDQYSLSDDSAKFLDRNSPAYMGSCTKFLLTDDIRQTFRDLTNSVRNGGCQKTYAHAPESPVWVEFARSMAPMMMMASQGLAGIVVGKEIRSLKVLDIAAGHGLFGIAVLRANPKAEVTAVDWNNVLEVARENAKKFDVADRYKTLAGSIFDVDIGTGYDLILVPNFVHHFDAPTNEQLLKKLHRALNPGGKVATLEFVPNEDRVSPPMPAAFALIMLAETPAGDAYTRSELENMLNRAGFSRHEFHPMPPSPHSVLVSTKE